MSLLDGSLQQMFGAAFGTVLLDGRHYQRTQTRNSMGDVSAAVTKVQSIKGCRVTTQNRRTGDEGSGDALQLIVLQTYDGRALNPIERGDVVALDGVRVRVGNIDEDAAHAAWFISGAPD